MECQVGGCGVGRVCAVVVVVGRSGILAGALVAAAADARLRWGMR
jgi:hypothetical protein